jgi:hypothetical protein
VRALEGEAYPDHDAIRQQSFEWDAHRKESVVPSQDETWATSLSRARVEGAIEVEVLQLDGSQEA